MDENLETSPKSTENATFTEIETAAAAKEIGAGLGPMKKDDNNCADIATVAAPLNGFSNLEKAVISKSHAKKRKLDQLSFEGPIAKKLKIMHFPEEDNDNDAPDQKRELQYGNVRDAKRKGIIEYHILGTAIATASYKELSLNCIQFLFEEQLPQMSPEFISCIIFEQKHNTLALTKNKELIGAICFQPFPTQKFSEIVFVSVKASEQKKGYGTMMMQHLKELIRALGMTDLLVYTNQNAYNYFKKLGFTQDKFPSHTYKGLIKIFSMATLMHCVLRPAPNLTIKALPSISIDGVEVLKIHLLENDTNKLFKLLQAMRFHGSAWPFLRPVRTKIAPNYYDVIKNPVDLQTIGNRLKRGYYKTRSSFIEDMNRMFANCDIYNTVESGYPDLADALKMFFVEQMRVLGLWND